MSATGEIIIEGWNVAADWLPDSTGEVLVTDMESIWIGYYDGDVWRSAADDEEFDSVITHWMALPELPE